MGLNYAFILVLERSDLPRLEQSILARLAPDSSPPGLTAPLTRSMEEGDYRFATHGEASPHLTFVDPTSAAHRIGGVSVSRVEGRRYALVSLRAAFSSLSRRFDQDPEVIRMITALAAEGGVLAMAFDREEDRLNAVTGSRRAMRQPLESTYLPFWCDRFGEPQLADARRRALDDRATILACRLPSDSDEEVMDALLDDDAFDADVDGYAAHLLAAFAATGLLVTSPRARSPPGDEQRSPPPNPLGVQPVRPSASAEESKHR
jgi:hypothetical protein